MLLLTDDDIEFGAATALQPLGFTVAKIIGFDGSSAIMRGADGAEWRLAHPPASCLGLVTFGATPWRDPLVVWWRERSDAELALLTLPQPLAAETRDKLLAEWLTARLANLLNIVSSENRSLLTQNRALRRSYDALQSTFSALEEFVVSNELQTPVLHHEMTPSAFWTPTAQDGAVRQKLPILSTQLSFFELFFRKPASSSCGPVHLALRLEPSGALLQESTLAPDEVVDGWNAFRPPPTVAAPEEVIVELRWLGGASAPSIGLSEPHGNAPHGYETDGAPGDSGQRRSLAMRVWRGPAGVAAPKASADAPATEPRLNSLAPIELLRAREHDFSGRLKKGAQPGVQEREGRLLVHPFGKLPTIAALPNALPAGVTYVSVEGRTLEERASPIAYAIAVVGENVAPEKIFLRGMRPANGFSGWRILPPKQPTRISLTLNRPTRGDERLYLATRLPAGSTESWAWSTWRDVKIGVNWRPETATAEITGTGRTDTAEANAAPAILWRGDWLAHVPWLAKPVTLARYFVVDTIDFLRSLISRLMRVQQ